MKVITLFKGKSNDEITSVSLGDVLKRQEEIKKQDSPFAGTPTAGTNNAPAEPPIKSTGQLTREDLAKPSEWKKRRKALQERMKRHKAVSEGKIGTADPRQKNDKVIKPSGFALGD